MAYVNVAEWSPDQVAEWLKGLDDVLQPYIHSFVTKNITGSRLLHLAPDDFGSLNISCIGHQEIILQGAELLSNIHYQIHQENVQHLALRLSSKARSIYNELRISALDSQYRNGNLGEEEKEKDDKEIDVRLEGNQKDVKKERVSTSILSGVADVLSSVKVLVSWLHRTPFHGIEQYDELKSHLLDLSIRLATIAQRDSFAENPVSVIRESCLKLAEMADAIIQDSKDPLILQPAFLDVVTIKKRADDSWGLGIYSSYHGVHQISMLRALSPAHTCGKLMGGDQVVQVNYQTVVGWTSHKVTQLMQENPVQVILTVKKCPRHVNTITEIYFKPFRLPSKKRTYSPWINNPISNQCYDLQSIPNLQFRTYDGRSAAAAQRVVSTEPHPKSKTPPAASLNSSGSDIGVATPSETDSDEVASDLDDDAFMSDVDYGGETPSLSGRLFQPKPRPHVQRRATIPGATARHTLPFDHLLQGYCHRQLVQSPIGDSFSQDSYVFRNKESPENRVSRPHTCIGTEKKETDKRRQWKQKEEGEMPFIDESDEKEDSEGNETSSHKKQSPSIASDARQSHSNKASSSIAPIKVTLRKESKESKESVPGASDSPVTSSPPKSPIESIDEVKAIRRISDERPKLDKSYSSPTYDLDDREAAIFLEKNTELKKTPKAKSPLAAISTGDDKDPRVEVPEISVKEETVVANETRSVEEELSTSSDTVQIIPSDVMTDVRTDVFSLLPDDDFHPTSVVSLALSSIQSTAPSVPSVASENRLYMQGFKGNNCTFSKDADTLLATNKTSSEVACEPLSVENPRDESLSKYVDMNKPLVNKNALDSQNTNPHEYHNCTQQHNGGGLLVAKPSGIDYPDAGVGYWGSGGGPNPSLEIKTSAPDSSLNSYSVKVVLRESKSRSPSAWRRGLITDASGNRRISCRDLGLGDHHGWLYRRKESKGFLLSHRWEKRWFILKKSYLYGYRDKDALKADSLIYLPGFHVYPASDVKSKRFAFKIYHSSGATFYFACDTTEERSRWMSQMGVSAISSVSQQPHQEKEAASPEAYYSETDDELEKSPSMQRSPLTPTARVTSGKEGMPLAKLSGTPGAPSVSSKTATPSPNSRGSTSTRMSSLGSLTSLAGNRQGLKFLQSSKGALSQPLPTQNFRSYIRVREAPSAQSSPATEVSPKGVSPVGGSPIEGKERKDSEGKGVRRKGSLRERLKQLPASLTLDRRKNPKQSPPSGDSGPLKTVIGSKSETSLLDPSSGGRAIKKEMSPSKSNAQLPNYMRPTHASFLHTEGDAPSPTSSKGGRRGSIGGLSLSSSSLRSLSPRRGSLDCLVSKGISPPMSPGRSTTGSTGSIATQEEYREGSPEKLWINSLRSTQRHAPHLERKMEDRGREGDRLKRTIHYQPLQRNKGDMMQFAFELSLSTSPKKNHAPTPPKTHQPSPAQRPHVPPRTKFLSPSERLVSSPPFQVSPPSPITCGTASPLRSKAPPNLILTPPKEDLDSPKTPLKPTMGVSMIGKQRRTPGVLSPREILPEYPGMEYPPTFEPESYTLNLPSEGGYASPPHPNLKEGLGKGVSPSSPSPELPSTQTQRKPSGSNPGCVHISHVSNTMVEMNVKSYHHNIYVTSPCKDSLQETLGGRMGRQPPPLPPNKPSKGAVLTHQKVLLHSDNTQRNAQRIHSSTSASPLPFASPDPLHQDSSSGEYVAMSSVVGTTHMYLNASSVNRPRLKKPKESD